MNELQRRTYAETETESLSSELALKEYRVEERYLYRICSNST